MKKTTSVIGKILIGIVLLFTLLMALQSITLGAMSLGLLTVSFLQSSWAGSVAVMKGFYLISGICALVASVMLFIRVYIKK
jgi:hypothetical protein